MRKIWHVLCNFQFPTKFFDVSHLVMCSSLLWKYFFCIYYLLSPSHSFTSRHCVASSTSISNPLWHAQCFSVWLWWHIWLHPPLFIAQRFKLSQVFPSDERISSSLQPHLYEPSVLMQIWEQSWISELKRKKAKLFSFHINAPWLFKHEPFIDIYAVCSRTIQFITCWAGTTERTLSVFTSMWTWRVIAFIDVVTVKVVVSQFESWSAIALVRTFSVDTDLWTIVNILT